MRAMWDRGERGSQDSEERTCPDCGYALTRVEIPIHQRVVALGRFELSIWGHEWQCIECNSAQDREAFEAANESAYDAGYEKGYEEGFERALELKREEA